MNDVWQICEKKGNRSGCAAEQRGLHQTKRKEKQHNQNS